MKHCAVLLFILSIGMCFGVDFPAGEPTEIYGLVITSSIDLNIRQDIDISHPAITDLPHYEYLVEPIVIGLSGTGQADITVAQNLTHTYTSVYYGNNWHKAHPYAEHAFAEMALEQVDFEAGSEVILLLGRNDPFTQVVFESFTVTYTEGEPDFLRVTWTTASETGLSSFQLFAGKSSDLEQAVYIHGPVAATNTDQPQTYVYEINNPLQGFTHYFWLKLVDNMYQGYFHGPVSVAVGPPYVLRNKVYPVIPNPNNGTFWIPFVLQDSTFVNIVLLDSTNTVVKEIRLNERMTGGGHMFRVNYFDLPEGLYRIYYWFEQENGPFYAYGDVLIEPEIGNKRR